MQIEQVVVVEGIGDLRDLGGLAEHVRLGHLARLVRCGSRRKAQNSTTQTQGLCVDGEALHESHARAEGIQNARTGR